MIDDDRFFASRGRRVISTIMDASSAPESRLQRQETAHEPGARHQAGVFSSYI
ncbi:unnamed protein product [Amoebophrya sp. A25]|nr:unnamed protein product [Amoebophrya sp. A25]|eukprot:GSA25T00021662001.1